MGILGTTARTAGRWSPWARIIAVAEIAVLVKRHLDNLGPGELGEMKDLLAKSKGRPGNLSDRERKRLAVLAKKVEPAAFAKTATMRAMPLRKK